MSYLIIAMVKTKKDQSLVAAPGMGGGGYGLPRRDAAPPPTWAGSGRPGLLDEPTGAHPCAFRVEAKDGDGRSVAQYAAEGGHAEVLCLGYRPDPFAPFRLAFRCSQ